MSKGKWLNNIARLIAYTKDNKKGYFLKFERQSKLNKETNKREYIGENPFPLVINEGDTFQAKLKKDDLQRLVDEGKMTAETAAKICETVKFEFSKAPARDGAPASSGPETEDDGVNF